MNNTSGNTAYFRFYEELNDFLPKEIRKIQKPYLFSGKPSIKDAIEAQGVPHPEVDLIIVNGDSVGFDYHLKDGDQISVYPVFECFDISPLVKLRDAPLRVSRFVVDVNLGKLAKLLRMLGFDTVYNNNFNDKEVAEISSHEQRIVLTRDRQLLQEKIITHGYWVRSQMPGEQIREVVKRFDLFTQIIPFRRCFNCNGLIHAVEKTQIIERLQPKTKLNDLRHSRRLIGLRPQRALIAPKALTSPALADLGEHHCAPDHGYTLSQPFHPTLLC